MNIKTYTFYLLSFVLAGLVGLLAHQALRSRSASVHSAPVNPFVVIGSTDRLAVRITNTSVSSPCIATALTGDLIVTPKGVGVSTVLLGTARTTDPSLATSITIPAATGK